MTIRKEALNSKAFQKLKEIHDNRESIARDWKAQGKKVAGILGWDVPEELLMAADILPYRIYGTPDISMKEADQYLEFAFPPVLRSQFEKIIDGANADLMDCLIISNSTDALVRIYYYIREVAALEPEKPIPELYFIDWLFTRFRMHQVRNEKIVGQFREKLEAWSGKKLDDQEILKAADQCNRNRELLEKMAALRREGRINGSEALVIIGSSFYMEKDAHSVLLEDLLQEAAAWQTVSGVKLFLTGSGQEQSGFYQLLEEHGMVVVGEDHDWGDRHWNKKIDTSLEPIKGIVARYMLRRPGPKRAFVSERVEAICRSARACGAEGVIAYTYLYDDAPSWDFPEQKKALKEMGIPMLQLTGRPYGVEEGESLKTKLEEFASSIKEV